MVVQFFQWFVAKIIQEIRIGLSQCLVYEFMKSCTVCCISISE